MYICIITEIALNKQILNEIELRDSTKKGLIKKVKNHFGNGLPEEKSPIFIDGTACGFIFSFTNRDYSHGSEEWQQIDYVEFFKAKPINSLI